MELEDPLGSFLLVFFDTGQVIGDVDAFEDQDTTVLLDLADGGRSK
ncbi:MAG: hypothetical protein WD532_01650 [Acidimicrobiia bacterium]